MGIEPAGDKEKRGEKITKNFFKYHQSLQKRIQREEK